MKYPLTFHRNRLGSVPLALLVLVSCGQNPGPNASALPVDPCSGAWVRLFDDANLSGRQLTIAYPTDHPSLRAAALDSGAGDLNDRTTSAQWAIPEGCKLVLYEDENYRGTDFPLVGSGRAAQNPNIGTFSDRASSARWERM